MPKLSQLIKIIAITLCLSLFNNAFATPATSNASVLADINAYRFSHGLSKLRLDESISQIAKSHSQMMAQHKIAFGHGGFSDRTHRLYSEFPRAQGMAENVAYAQVDDTNAIVQLWLTSSGHRKNIMGSYNLTGIGVAHSSNGDVYVTQIFVKAGA